ncbi:MAG: phage holin family protein [Bacteroides sp.]|jgi:hypothetical protein|nr:phage holin family protein [Bacteroides sp.]MCI1682146.1 phage holin family protein [Bacteroides sp.]
MFTSDKDIKTIEQLFVEVKEYIKLQKDYIKLELAEKLTTLLSTFILLFIALSLGIVTLFYLSIALAYILSPIVGGLTISFIIIAFVQIILITLVIIFRRKIIINPIAKFIATLFFK